MREIKFKGKHNGGWKYGYISYDYHKNEHQIINPQGTWPIISETISQDTGLKDKRDKEIYENDIVKTDQGIAIIVWNPNGSWCIRKPDARIYELQYWKVEVIGNIHENPELLE